MALYPDTSVFYRAEVLGNPKTVAKVSLSGALSLSRLYSTDQSITGPDIQTQV